MDEDNLEVTRDKNNEMKVLEIPEDMTIGIEIESDGPSTSELYKESIFRNLGWTVTTDNGLSEVISPVLYGNSTQNTNQIYTVCRKLQERGQIASINGGAHVHIGNNYLHSISAVQNFVDIWCNCEKIMFCISNPPGEITRPDGAYYAYPISGMLAQNYPKLIKEDSNDHKKIEQYEELLIETADKHNPYATDLHCRAVNLYTHHHTFEFRLANSTVNPETWIENINLFGGIIRAAKEVTDIQAKPKAERTPQERLKLYYLDKINDESISEDERLEALLNLAVNTEQRDVYRERYSKNNEALNNNPEMKKNLLKKMSDGKIHFNQASYRESMELDGLEKIDEVKRRVQKLVREYILANEQDKKFIETYFPNIDQFKTSYLDLRNMGLEEELYKGLDLLTLDYSVFSNHTINLLKQKQNELAEKQKEEEKNQQTKEDIIHKSNTIPKNLLALYNGLRQSELSVGDVAKRLGLEFSIYGVDQWDISETIKNITRNIGDINNDAQRNENLSDNTKTLSMFNGIEYFVDNSTYAEDYSNELRDTFEKGFNDKVQALIQKSKIDRLNREQQKIENEKVSFIERLLGKGKLQKAEIENIKLRKKNEIGKEKKEKVSLEDSLADLYAYVKTDLGGVFTPEIKDFLKRVNNEPYVMNKINIEDLKAKIEKKSKENMKKGEVFLIPTKRGLRKYKDQTILLENENKQLELNMADKKIARQNIPSFIKANKTEGTIQRFKKDLDKIRKLTTQDQGENAQLKEKHEEQNEELE